MTTGPSYLYAVVGAGSPVPAVGRCVEPSVGPLQIVAQGRVAAVAGPFGADRVRPSRRNLLAHERVVEAMMREGPVLPCRFGLVVASAGDLARFLEDDAGRLSSLLGRFESTVEMRVRARWTGDAALREVLHGSPRIQRLRQRSAGYTGRIALGEAVAEALDLLRERDSAAFSRRLLPLAREERRLPPDTDETIMRAAYLVEGRQRDRFERAVAALADGQRGRAELQLVGPLAPWDFVEIDGSQRRAVAAAGGRR